MPQFPRPIIKNVKTAFCDKTIEYKSQVFSLSHPSLSRPLSLFLSPSLILPPLPLSMQLERNQSAGKAGNNVLGSIDFGAFASAIGPI